MEPLRKRDASLQLKLDDALTPDEVRVILAAHAEERPRSAADAKLGERSVHARARRRELFVHLALLGLRRGELAGLRWSAVTDLDGENPELTISATRVVVNGEVIDQDGTKTASGARVLPIPPHVVKIMQRVRVEQADFRKQRGKNWQGPGDPWVLAHPNGKPVQPNTLDHQWADALAFSGVPHRRLHASRHTAATTLIVGGAPAAVVAAWLGHADGGVLALRTYGHVGRDDLTSVAGMFAPR